jgi:DNA repair exonuclease SbcCD ATPase subunit
MIINQITFKNFKLLKNVVLNFNKINIIKGENASGKSSILNGIILSLYGEGSRINLVKLVSFGSKSAEITIETDRFTVIRRIPTDLIINQNNVEVKLNTSTIKQNWINDQIGTYDFFRKYRLFNKQAVNLLDLGIISLRKELMTFIDTDFSTIRQSLLNKKLERENLNVNKKLYKFYLSEKRLQILNAGLDSIKTSYLEFEKDRDTQNGIVNQLKTEIQTRERMIYNRKRELEEAQKSGICPILKTKCTQITREITPEQQS